MNSRAIANLRKMLNVPSSKRLLERLIRRLKNGEELTGSVTLNSPTDAERDYFEALLGGRQSRGNSLRVDLDALTEVLRHAELCESLSEAMEMLFGPITNARAVRAARAAEWDRMFDEARHRAAERPELLSWLSSVREKGLLPRSNAKEAEKLLRHALTALLALPTTDLSLPVFATNTLGDSHALDYDRPVTGLVLRALAAQAGIAQWADAESRRAVWASAGVISDEVSAPVLFLNLPVLPNTPAGGAAEVLARAGEPGYLTVRQLLHCPPEFAQGEGRTVFVCENPAVIEAAANVLGADCPPLVCLQGQPKTSGRLLLSLLTKAGWDLVYHGDFDWPGVQIANLVLSKHSVRPWRMGTADYLAAAPSQVELVVPRFTPLWDPLLGDAMDARGSAVLEEQVLGSLLEDLRAGVA